MKGTVKFFNNSKGYGFISSEDGKDYFVHITGILNETELHDGDAVNFEVEEGDRGPKAVNVSKDDGSSAASSDEEPMQEEAQEESEDSSEEAEPMQEESEDSSEEASEEINDQE